MLLADYSQHESIYEKQEDWAETEYNFEDDWLWFTTNSHLNGNIAMLELGCGSAPYLSGFKRIAISYLGIDISSHAIQTARKKTMSMANVDFRCTNFITDWKNKKKFDLIVDSFLLHCIIGDDRDNAMTKIYNSLSQNGELWINTMCNPPKIDEVLKAYNKKTRCLEVYTGSQVISVRQFDSPNEIREMIGKAGLTIVEETIQYGMEQDNYLAICRKK